MKTILLCLIAATLIALLLPPSPTGASLVSPLPTPISPLPQPDEPKWTLLKPQPVTQAQPEAPRAQPVAIAVTVAPEPVLLPQSGWSLWACVRGLLGL